MFLLDAVAPSPFEAILYGLSEGDLTTILAVAVIAVITIVGILVIKKR
jgi:hypothetical protein